MSNSQEPRVRYVYDDKTENLLDQFSQQLAVEDKIFAEKNKTLNQHDYACARDNDQVLGCILEVIAKIYEQAIPIAIIVDRGPVLKGGDISSPSRGPAH
tara:strand:+ start:1253 stop:1549 length:297 start_codon:yes stop_codon:yes gene_type:complete